VASAFADATEYEDRIKRSYLQIKRSGVDVGGRRPKPAAKSLTKESETSNKIDYKIICFEVLPFSINVSP
jgi:hypothetical protein